MGKTKKRQANKDGIRSVRESGTGIERSLTAQQREAEKLYLNDLSPIKIANVLGCDPRTIYKWIKNFGWKEKRVQIEKTPEYIQGVLLQKLAEE